jgi:hypothetical protein
MEGQSARLQPPKGSLGMVHRAISIVQRILPGVHSQGFPRNCLPAKISILKGVLPLGGGSQARKQVRRAWSNSLVRVSLHSRISILWPGP